ncbi:MAG: TlpA family protein disulfide reductase, partial [Winogradskyella sp.]|nr:TlpA family protein disulfide reductase [Winogradskyella sp.]
YNDKVIFLFITSDDFETVEQFKLNKEFDFKVYRSLNKAPEAFRRKSIPRTFVINKRGEIVIDESGAIDWSSAKVRQQLDILLSE